MYDRLIPSGHPPSAKIEPAWWFIFAAQKMMVIEEGMSASIPLIVDPASLGFSSIRERYLGTLAGRNCYCAEVSENGSIPPKIGFYGLRYLYERLAEPMFAIAMTASHLMEWEETTRYCGRCGREMVPAKEMNARECSGCGRVVFPRISPAVIVLVEREGQVLLARSTRFTADFLQCPGRFCGTG